MKRVIVETSTTEIKFDGVKSNMIICQAGKRTDEKYARYYILTILTVNDHPAQFWGWVDITNPGTRPINWANTFPEALAAGLQKGPVYVFDSIVELAHAISNGQIL